MYALYSTLSNQPMKTNLISQLRNKTPLDPPQFLTWYIHRITMILNYFMYVERIENINSVIKQESLKLYASWLLCNGHAWFR